MDIGLSPGLISYVFSNFLLPVQQKEHREDDERKAKKTELTLGKAFEAVLNGHVKQHCVAVKNIEGDFRRYLSDWNDRQLSSITKAEVQNRMNKVGESNGKTAANHMLSYARAAIN